MKYLIVSDIHGSLAGAETMEYAFHKHHPDRILCPGDVLYHGPRNDVPEDYAPKKVIEIMNDYADKIIAVRGNCDAEVDRMVLAFPISADYNILPFGDNSILLTHGHVYTPEKHPALKKGDIFLSGHTHIPTAVRTDGIFYLNPGSVSLPKENHPRSYGILDEHGFTVYTAKHTSYMHIAFGEELW